MRLQKFRIHSTEGTAVRLLGTGVFERQTVTKHPPGRSGGIAELAAMLAKGAASAAIVLLDPADPWSDSPENRALKRVCIQLNTPLITTYVAARRWLEFEALDPALDSLTAKASDKWQPYNYEDPYDDLRPASLVDLPLLRRTLALISHDGKKLQMVRFANENSELLARHARILTTGTTGWMLKLLFATPELRSRVQTEVASLGKYDRIVSVLRGLLEELERAPKKNELDYLLTALQQELRISPSQQFADLLMPLPSGPEGGDVIIAEQILKNRCHSIVFFHDPSKPHPHEADIRLFEHTSQLEGVYAECVSEEKLASRWIESLELEGELSDRTDRVLAEQIRRQFAVDDVVLVDAQEDADRSGDALGKKLATAAAGYFNQKLIEVIAAKGYAHVGVAWGKVCRWILDSLSELEQEGCLERPRLPESRLKWSPVIGVIPTGSLEEEANAIAAGFATYYGGEVALIACPGFTKWGEDLPEGVDRVVDQLETADIVLTAAGPLRRNADEEATALDIEEIAPRDSGVAAVVHGIFLDAEGGELIGPYACVGLGYKGLQRAAARGAVILICAGKERQEALQAVLKAQLVSTLVTSTSTAEALLREAARANSGSE